MASPVRPGWWAMAKPRRAGRGRGVDATGRSKGEGQYAPLPYALLQSAVWRALSGAAVKVWLELRSRYNGGNNGRLTLSLEEAAPLLRLGKATVLRAFNELVAAGLIVKTQQGRWYGRLASEWAVTDRGMDGAPPSNAWRQCQPPLARPPRKGRPHGRRRKTERGSKADPSGDSTGPMQNRSVHDGSTAVPVSAISTAANGSGMDR